MTLILHETADSSYSEVNNIPVMEKHDECFHCHHLDFETCFKGGVGPSVRPHVHWQTNLSTTSY